MWNATRDLRVASYLCVAATKLDGLGGLSNGLSVIQFLIEQMWDVFYPRLDPDDDNDPLERLNILAMLSPEPGAFDDPVMFLSKLRQVRLMPELPYTLRDIMIANGELESEHPVDAKLIAAEMMGMPIEKIQAQAERVKQIDEKIEAICTAMNEKMGGNYSLNMSSLQKELRRFSSFYAKHLESFSAGQTEDPISAESGDSLPKGEHSEENTVIPTRNGRLDPASLKATNRAEALLLLKKGAEYFQTEEPNSPVPFLINRALRFSEMNFMDLLADIAPDALQRGRDILGVRPSDENSDE